MSSTNPANMPTEQKTVQYGTKIVNNEEEILNMIRERNMCSDSLCLCASTGTLEFSYNFVFDTYPYILKKQKFEKNGIRCVTTITEDSIELVKKFLEIGIQIRHVPHLPPLNFGISDSVVLVTVDHLEDGKKIQNLIVSNEQHYLRTFSYMFESSWKSGIDARERIVQIEEGNTAEIEVLPNSIAAKQKYLELVRSAQNEVMIISPTSNAFYRQLEVMGLMALFKEISRRGVLVRILAPATKVVTDELEYLVGSQNNENIDVRFIQEASDTKATFAIIDKKYSLVTEIKDDSKQTFEEAIGYSIYSSSGPGVLSYVSIFENLWIYSKLYDQIKRLSTMQKEFINIAAHELRTPLQPIIGMAEVIRYGKLDKKSQDELLDLIIKNTSRLSRLAENILDVTRIDSQSLKLYKEPFNLRELCADVVKDFAYGMEPDGQVRIEFKSTEDLFVDADRARVTQVIMNILNNAAKFTEKGEIHVTLESKASDAVITVKDSGSGIAQDVMPSLFSKFSNSSSGMGLGLYISKVIIDAHQGKIWAQNNPDGRGATFGFSLPLTITH